MMHIHEMCVCSIMSRNNVCSRKGCRSAMLCVLSLDRKIVMSLFLILVPPDTPVLMRSMCMLDSDILIPDSQPHQPISAFLQKPPPSLIHQNNNLPIPSPGVCIRIAFTIKPSFCPSRDICRSDRTWECYYYHRP